MPIPGREGRRFFPPSMSGPCVTREPPKRPRAALIAAAPIFVFDAMPSAVPARLAPVTIVPTPGIIEATLPRIGTFDTDPTTFATGAATLATVFMIPKNSPGSPAASRTYRLPYTATPFQHLGRLTPQSGLAIGTGFGGLMGGVAPTLVPVPLAVACLCGRNLVVDLMPLDGEQFDGRF